MHGWGSLLPLSTKDSPFWATALKTCVSYGADSTSSTTLEEPVRASVNGPPNNGRVPSLPQSVTHLVDRNLIQCVRQCQAMEYAIAGDECGQHHGGLAPRHNGTMR